MWNSSAQHSFFGFLYAGTVLAIVNVAKHIILLFVSHDTLEKFFVDDFGNKRIMISYDKSCGKLDETKYDCEMIVHNRELWRRLVRDGDLALGESYMDGWWDCDDFPSLIGPLAKENKLKWLHTLESEWNYQRHSQAIGKASKEVVDLHYNLGDELYLAQSDKRITLSCAYWKPGTRDLDEAQVNKMDLIARKLKLKPGMKVMDIGCGFGATAKYIAQNYGVSVVGYNLSERQVHHARKLCEGLPVEFRNEDYRFATGQYDAIFSTGFFEHVGKEHHREYFEVVNRCLKDDGLTLLHSITMRDHTFNPPSDAWLDKYIYPGGELPYPQDFFDAAEGMFMVEDLHNFGFHYARTLHEWDIKFNKAWPDLKPKYGRLWDGRFQRCWNYYQRFCIALFTHRITNVYQVVYSKKGVKGGYESVR